jgi:hypothetical protein
MSKLGTCQTCIENGRGVAAPRFRDYGAYAPSRAAHPCAAASQYFSVSEPRPGIMPGEMNTAAANPVRIRRTATPRTPQQRTTRHRSPAPRAEKPHIVVDRPIRVNSVFCASPGVSGDPPRHGDPEPASFHCWIDNLTL